MTIKEIRKDLSEIKYYYSRIKEFNYAENTVGKNDIIFKAEKCNNVIKTASPIIYDIYIGLYIKNLTQEALADELGFSSNYIYKINRKLIRYLQKKLEF